MDRGLSDHKEVTMLTKLKLALALTATLVAGAAGFAAANTGTAADDAGSGGWRAKILQKYDANGDGKLDDSERATMRADMQAKRAERHQKMLAKYDLNKDGKLDASERTAMREAKAEKRFTKLDTNGDGVISKEEFKAGAAKMKMHHGRRGFGKRFRGRGQSSPGAQGGGTNTGGGAPDAQ
nr:EF-hand domain-containing protein [Kofleriaceae bacterium]